METGTPPPPSPRTEGKRTERLPPRLLARQSMRMGPTGRALNVNIVEARGLGSRDKNGSSNPFAILYDPVTYNDGRVLTKMKTKVVKKTLSPVWNTEFKVGIPDEKVESIVVEVFHKRQILMGSSKKISLGAAVIPINDLSSTTRDQWYSLYPAKNVQGRNTHSKGGDLLPVSGEIHIVMNIVNEKAANEPPPPTVPKEGPEPEVPKIVATEQEDEPAKSRDQEPQKKRVSEDTKTKLKNLLNTSTYAQRLMNSKRLEIQTSGLITSYFTITYTQDSFSKHLESELEKLPEVDLLSVPFPAMITEMYPYVDHNILSPTIWAFCAPDGFYISKSKNEPTIFGFTLTDAEGNNSHVTCLKSYEHMDASIKKLVGEHLKLEDTEELYFPKCFCILTKYPFHSFMRCLVKEIYRAVSERKSYSNRLIAFALRSLPDLSKTVNPVTVTIGETHLPVIKGERSGDMPYTEVPYKYIFQSLRVGEIVYIFNTLLSEEKVVFVSDSITKLCIFTDFMKTIMYPFKWAYTFIPILPLCLIDYLGSPTPFIIGMLTKHQRLIPKSELDSLCIVNLDTGELTRPMSTNIPDLPVEEKKRLVADLSAVLTSTQESPDSLDWDFRQKTRRKETISDEEFGLQIRVSFVRFFCRILYDYHKYIVFLRVFGQGKKGPTLMFDKNGFISSRAQNSSDERFWKRITSSQGFSVFVNDYSRPRYEVFSECLAKDIREMNVADIAEMIAPREPVEVEGITISLDLDDSDDDDDDNDNEDTVEVSPEGVFGAVVQPPPTLAQEQERSDFAFVSDELDWNRVKPVSISESARRTIIRFIDLMAVGGGKVVDESIIPQITETLKSQKCLIVFSRELTNKDLLKVNNGKLDEMEFGILGDVCKSALTESQKTNDTEVAENIFEFSTTYYKILEGAEEFLTVRLRGHDVWRNINFWETYFYKKIGLLCRNLYSPSIFKRMIAYESLSDEEKNVVVNKELDEVFNNLADLLFKMASIGVEENLLRSFANKMSFTVKLDQERREFLKQLMANLTKMKLREDTDEYTYVGRCSAGDQQDELLLSISKDEKRKLPRQRAVRRKDSTQGKRLSATPSLSEGYDGDDVSYGLNDDASEEEDEDSELANKSDITRMFKMNKAAYNNSNSNINNAQKQDSCSEVLLKGHKGPILCLNHIGTTLFSGSADGGIKIWDTHGEVCLGTVNAHKNWVSCLDVNRENNTVIAGSYDRSISITDIESVRGDCKYRLLCGHTGPVTAVQFHPRGVLSASADSTVCLWDPRARREAATLRGHSSAVLCIDSRGENVVVSGGKDFSVKLWDLRIGRPIFEFPQVHRDWVKSCMILDTGADDGGSTVATATAAVQKPEQELEKVDGITWKVLSCGYDGVMVVWDPQRGEQVRIVEQKDTIAGAVRLGDERIVSATAGGLINMWNKDLSGEPTTVQQGGDGDEGSEEVTAVGRFNNFVVSGSTNSQIKVWNPLAEDPSLMCRQTLQTHSRKTTCFSQYESYSFASAGWDGTVQLWSFPVEFR